MVAVRQFSTQVRLPAKMVGLSIAYDGKEKLGAHKSEELVNLSYQKGHDDSTSQYNQHILELRTDMNELREQCFSKMETKFETIVDEARSALTQLTFEAVQRVLGGFQMEAAAVESIVESVISEAGLDEEEMQVRLTPEDIELLVDLEPKLKERHPHLEFLPDSSLSRGDCLLSSRFGKVDGRISTKLTRLGEGLGI